MALDTSSSGQDVTLFVVAQTAETTEVTPSATDTILASGPVALSQVPITVESRERRGRSYDAPAQLTAGVGKGTGSFQTYVKPSGTAGTAPEIGPLLESLFGIETIVPGTSVTYTLRSPDLARQFYTLWRLLGTTLRRAIGSYVTACTFRIQATRDVEGFIYADWTVGCYSLLKTPTSTTTADVTAATDPTIPVNNVGEFAVGQILLLGNETTPATGFVVNAVTPAMNQITVTGTLANDLPSGSVIRPWTPTPTRVGDELGGRIGTTNWGTNFMNIPIISAEIPVDLQVADIPGQQGAGQYIEGLEYGQRQISWSMTLVHTPQYEAMQSHILLETEQDLVLTVGDTAGERVVFTLNDAKITSAEEIDGTPMQMRFTGTAQASTAGNDVLQIAFT